MSTLENYMKSRRSGLYDGPKDNKEKKEETVKYETRSETMENKNLIISFVIVGLLVAIIYLLISDRMPSDVKDVKTTVEKSYNSAKLNLKAEFLKWIYNPETGFGLDCKSIKRVSKGTLIGRGCHVTVGNRIENGKLYPGERLQLHVPSQALN